MSLEEALCVYTALQANPTKAEWNRQIHLEALNIIEKHADSIIIAHTRKMEQPEEMK